ncbi:hypothetical protein ACTFIT_005034 [Dictyostelium discoideum]
MYKQCILVRTNNNISIGDESFNNLSIGNVLGNANAPNPMENQRIIIRRVLRPTVPPIQETVQIATNPRVTYILEYESLQKVCQSKYYSDGDVSGGSNEDCTSQNIFARLTKWVSNKESNTRTKVADSLAIYSKGEKNHNLKVYISDSQVFFGNEIFSPALLSLFLSHINYENYQNDIFIKEFVDSLANLIAIIFEKIWHKRNKLIHDKKEIIIHRQQVIRELIKTQRAAWDRIQAVINKTLRIKSKQRPEEQNKLDSLISLTLPKHLKKYNNSLSTFYK